MAARWMDGMTGRQEIFLSASVPKVGRGNYHETADPFLIQLAVREFVVATVREYGIVWGGHPAITPMIRAICEDLGADYRSAFVLYMSRFFEAQFPDDAGAFSNVVLTECVPGNLEESLLVMRTAMLSRPGLSAAVFIGGMDGVEKEYEMFRRFHPAATLVAVGATGGASAILASRLGISKAEIDDVNFGRLFRERFGSQRRGGVRDI